MNSTNKCKHCGLVRGIHLLGCPNYQPPAKRSDDPVSEFLKAFVGEPSIFDNFTKGQK